MTKLPSALRSLLWPGLDTISTLVIGVVSVLLIARLIGAETFGLGALAQGIVLIPFVVVNSLVHDAIICQQDLTDEDIDSGFTATLVVGIFLIVLLGLVAPAIGRFLQEPRLPLVIWAFAPLLIFYALSSPLMAVRRRALDFGTVGRLQIVGRLIGICVGVVAAFSGAGVWSLVAQHIVTGAYMAGAILVSTPRWPRLRFSWRRVAPMLVFCRPIILSQFISQGVSRLFIVVIGYWHGLAPAGYWAVATRISDSIVGGTTQTVYNVALAHLGRIRSNRDQVVSSLDRAQGLSMLVTIPVLAALAASSEPLTQLLLGESWAPTGQLLVWLLLGAFFFLRRLLPDTALRAIGRSDVPARIALADGATAGLGLLLCGHYSPLAVAIVCGLSPLPGNLIIAFVMGREFGKSIPRELFELMRDLSCALAATLLGRITIYLSSSASPLIDAALAAMVAMVAATAMTMLTQSTLVNPLIKRGAKYLRRVGKEPA